MVHIELDEKLTNVLKRLESKGDFQVAIVGGYLRNKLLGVPINDIDMVIDTDLETLQTIFSRVEYTESGILFGVCRVNFNGIKLEFSLCKSEDFEEKLNSNRDFTMNTIYYKDGQLRASSERAFVDLENKLLVAATPPPLLAQKTPHYVLRPMKFVSRYGFDMDKKLVDDLIGLEPYFNEIKTGRLQKEFSTIVRGEYLFKSLKAYKEVGFIKKLDERIDTLITKKLPVYGEPMTPRIAYLMSLLGVEPIVEWLELHQVSENTIRRSIDLIKYLDDSTPINVKKWREILVLKRYQFQNDLKIIRKYFDQYKKAAI